MGLGAGGYWIRYRPATFDHPFVVLIDLDAASHSSYLLQFLVFYFYFVWNLESSMTILPFMCLGDVHLTCTRLLCSYPILGGYLLASSHIVCTSIDLLVACLVVLMYPQSVSGCH